MPRKSLRSRLVDAIHQTQDEYAVFGLLDTMDGKDDAMEEADDSSSLCGLVDLWAEDALDHVTNARYITERKTRRGPKKEIFERDLDECDSVRPPWLNGEEFLQKYRMSRGSFKRLVLLIKDHPVFNPKPNGKGTRRQVPVEWQLMVFLRYIGTTGSGGCSANMRSKFDIGRGTADLYKKRCITAIRSLRPIYIRWPSKKERRKIEKRIRSNYNLPGCVAVADGTLFPLTFAPQCKDAADYSGRKFPYSLTTMIVNDDQKRVIYYLAGFPGTAHDQKVYASTGLSKKPETHFTDKEYLIADSAMLNSPTVVASFKAPRGRPILERHEKFNTHLARLRITSEHTIGLLKGRFPWLRSIPMKVTEKRNSLKKILRIIESIVILHNFLLSVDDEGNDKLREDDGSSSDDDSDDSDDELEGLLQMTVSNTEQNDERRQNLLFYLEEYIY